jgi:L-lactate utilization protein LutC
VVGQLRKRGFEVVLVESLEDARREALRRIPDGASVLDAASRSLEETGILAALASDPRSTLLKPKLRAMDRTTQAAEIRRLSQSPDVVIGSVHAVTEDGEVLVASATGNQIGPYSFGAGRVIWVVGAQKIVPTLADGIERIEQYSLPLESARARVAYGRDSLIARILILRQDQPAGRTAVILVEQPLGF